jgi:5-methylcytosine-specific restriction endonuclease McrA
MCSTENCNNKVVARGWCNKHYLRWKNHGDPLGGGTQPRKPIDLPDGRRQCLDCNIIKVLNEFSFDKTYGTYRTTCKRCRASTETQKYLDPEFAQKRKAFTRSRRDLDRILETERYRKNPEKKKASVLKHIKSNPDAHRLRRLKRRAAQQENGVFVVAPKEIQKILNSVCIFCGATDNITVEHLIPLSRGGRHSIGNLAPSCKSCNSAKGTRTVMEFRLNRKRVNSPKRK